MEGSLARLRLSCPMSICKGRRVARDPPTLLCYNFAQSFLAFADCPGGDDSHGLVRDSAKAAQVAESPIVTPRIDVNRNCEMQIHLASFPL